ncbi:GDP-mannose 4,6-dehydratase [Aliifodinibius salicampi]|uniref:UDP-glucuronate decarboxylase n=1 Tax=Fodinibius salicampi TaxID=1920655 RepID=A0ABT3PZ13_9BACT|nr:GDP-mannose 4,6-dehydratase [Fodinibius salicampi]MCW9713076.1 GDP-mannose 4,6-dehydratase [Fodinibius salicampi]
MKYLITGGAGFIGSHLADRLLKDGHQITVIDNLSTGKLSNINHLRDDPNFTIKVASVMDYHTLEQLVEECDQIFHLAAAVGVKLIMENPVETIVTNVQGTENVLKLASYHDKKVLVASTSEVYGKLMEGNNGIDKLKEDGDWKLGPTSKRRWAYACSKAMDEFLSMAYYDEKKLPVVVARFFNTVGPRQTGTYGMVIPNFVQKALLNETIQVHGDGEQTRCFTYVKDAVDAIVKLMNTDDAEGEVFNIGGEEEISMNELASMVKELTDSESEIHHIPYEEVYGKGFEDMKRRTPDLAKIREAIGYEPTHTTEDILNNVIKYFRKESLVA